MRKRFIALLMASLALCAGTLACGKEEETRKDEIESNAIRIYDVEPQEREDCTAVQHYLRVGVLNDIGNKNVIYAPFANQIDEIEKETGAEIEYLLFDNWDELLEAEKKYEDAKVTEMILFNNSFDGSIVKEASSGRYADMESALTDLGFYEGETYNQEVLSAGIMEGQQVLVPILYNVSGMIQDEKGAYAYEDWKKVAYNHAESAYIDFEEFVDMLTTEMIQVNVEEMELPFMSPGFLEERVDLFLMASGMGLDSYERQADLFNILYHYLTTYQETQVDWTEDGQSNQMLYGRYINEYNKSALYADELNGVLFMLPEDDFYELKLESITYNEGEEPLFILASSLLDRTGYFVECSTAEEVAFHSVLGLLNYQNYYGKARMGLDWKIKSVDNMNYWPIGVLGSDTEYAAQPICYAAVVDGGSTRLAAKVVQSMMNQPINAEYGISTCTASMEKQLEEWIGSHGMGYVRVYTVSASGVVYEGSTTAYWDPVVGRGEAQLFEDDEIYVSQVRNQIDHIVSAEIPDREILAIWQDTLTESVESGLSSQAGFELLCERMDAWYE